MGGLYSPYWWPRGKLKMLTHEEEKVEALAHTLPKFWIVVVAAHVAYSQTTNQSKFMPVVILLFFVFCFFFYFFR
jgi:hypothetical protein